MDMQKCEVFPGNQESWHENWAAVSAFAKLLRFYM